MGTLEGRYRYTAHVALMDALNNYSGNVCVGVVVTVGDRLDRSPSGCVEISLPYLLEIIADDA